MQTIGTGIAFIVSDGSPIIPPPSSLGDPGSAKFGVFPTVVLIVAAVWFVQRYLPYGRIIMALGTCWTAAQGSRHRMEGQDRGDLPRAA